MSSLARIAIHPSQFPDRVRNDLLASLRSRKVNHKFHYDSIKQTQKWLALHQAYSPSRTEADCAATYDLSFDSAAKQLRAGAIHLVGLGCGGGQKDTRLLKLLLIDDREAYYTPIDVSPAMVLTARENALQVIEEQRCAPLVCDLAMTEDLPGVLNQLCFPKANRLLSFFGMLPNFEPELVLPRLSALVQEEDYLLLSANLVPEDNYAAGLHRLLPQYDNALTRDWLSAFLFDLGVKPSDGDLQFSIEETIGGLKRIVVHFQFTVARMLEVDSEKIEFGVGDTVRLFFSYRYTAARLPALLQTHGLKILDQWITKSEEEGVFLAIKAH